MCVPLLDVFKHLLLRKSNVLSKDALALKSKKVQGIFRKTFSCKGFFVSLINFEKKVLL